MSHEPSPLEHLSAADIDRIMEMGWEDRTPFEAIEAQFGLAEKGVIALMRREMKLTSFQMWRKRMAGRSTKHRALQAEEPRHFKSNQQRSISMNKISKR